MKKNAKLLMAMGAGCFCVGSFWSGPAVEFLSVLLLRAHIPGIAYGRFSYTLIAPGVVIIGYIGGELLTPSKKWVIVGIMSVAGAAFVTFLWLFTEQTFKPFEYPDPGLTDASFVLTYPTFWLLAFFIVYILVFMGTGFAVKAKKSSGDIRRKFFYLALAFYIFVITAVIDTILPGTILVGIFRSVMATFGLWIYLGLKV